MNDKNERDVWARAQLVDDKRHHVTVAIKHPDGRREVRRVGLRELDARIHLVDLVWMLSILKGGRPSLTAREMVTGLIALQLGLEWSVVTIVSHVLPVSGSHALDAEQPAARTP